MKTALLIGGFSAFYLGALLDHSGLPADQVITAARWSSLVGGLLAGIWLAHPWQSAGSAAQDTALPTENTSNINR